MAGGSLEADAVVARVRVLTDPLLAARRVELVELHCRREGPRVVLRFLVETVAGITVEQCGELNRAIGAVLDEQDVLATPYLLEVASPGADRLLRTVRDFERVIGRRVRLQVMTAARAVAGGDGTTAHPVDGGLACGSGAGGVPGARPRPGQRLPSGETGPRPSGQELVGMVVSVGEERVSLRLDQGETVRVALATVAWARQEMAFDR